MRSLVRLYDGLITGLVPLAGLMLAAVCGLIIWDVVARNLGLQPPESTVALTEYALLYLALAAGPQLVRQRGHVMVEILGPRLPPQLRRSLDRIIVLLCAAVAFGIAVLATLLLIEAWRRGEVDIRSLDVPRTWLFVPLVLGFSLMGTEFVRLLFQPVPDGEREAVVL